MNSTVGAMFVLYNAVNDAVTPLLDPALAWIVVLMVLAVASGFLWLLQREFGPREQSSRPTSRVHGRNRPRLIFREASRHV